VAAKLIVIVIVIMAAAFDGGLLDGAVHPFHLPLGPSMINLGEAVLCHWHRREITELDTIVGEDGMYLVGYCFEGGSKEIGGSSSACLFKQLYEGEFGSGSNGSI